MDAALLQAVQAQRAALQQFVSQGVEVNNKQMKGALANLEKMEDVFFSTVGKAAERRRRRVEGPVGSRARDDEGQGHRHRRAQAKTSVAALMSQAQTALREGRSAQLRSAQAMMDSYAALVSGVLIGMSEGLQSSSKLCGEAAWEVARRGFSSRAASRWPDHGAPALAFLRDDSSQTRPGAAHRRETKARQDVSNVA